MQRRKRRRIEGYDYSRDGYYFITTNIGRGPLFGHVAGSEMILNEYGRLVDATWCDLPNHYAHCVLDTHVVMPDHFHGVIEICKAKLPEYIYGAENNPRAHDITEMVRAFKSFSSRRINESLRDGDALFKWHRSFHVSFVAPGEALARVRGYIKYNPKNFKK